MVREIDKDRKWENFFVPEFVKIREKYQARVVPKPDTETSWPRTRVVIEKHNPDGTVEDVFTYDRNYAMYKTFEPFRHLKNGVWKDYALISTEYVRFEVVDLEAGEIVAVEPYPTITENHHNRWKEIGHPEWCEKDPVGTEKPGWGFCPVEFYVPDVWETADTPDDLYSYFEFDGAKRYVYQETELMRNTGQFALYAGCVWGDDSGGWKLRYIDLSRISEGIVTSDERFGYLELAGDLKKVDFWENGTVVIPTLVYANMKTGKAAPLDLNWAED